MLTATSHPAIQVLGPDVVERIAAGEVIERPVSVVRELLDNALDAGTGDIRIDVRGGGLRSIRVADDGRGIPPDEIDLALRHHATSKIRVAADLVGLASLGFRGEALPSITAVSETTLITAIPGGIGVRLDLRFGVEIGRVSLSRPPGTTITVRNLFGNTPARLKFMGGAATESRHISALVRRYALAHPDVRFSLTLDGHPSLATSGLGLDGTVTDVFGVEAGAALLPLGPWNDAGTTFSGLVSAPHLTRGTRRHVTLIVNHRCVSGRALLAAFEDAYRPLLARGRHPLAVLSLTVPPEDIDVNVHPSKQEVKIGNERTIAAAIREATRAALGRHLPVPAPGLRFTLGSTQPELPRLVAEPRPGYDVATRDRLRRVHVVGQVHGSLIAVEDAGGLYLVDQHRAHERAIYELLRHRHGEGRAGQLLLEPLHVELSQHQLARLEGRLPELAALGFRCEWFGGHSFLVRSVPVLPERGDLAAVVEDLLDQAAGDETDWQHRLLTSVACRSATRRGAPLTVEGCRELIALLADTESPAICPHGSPIVLHFDERFLKRQFQW